MQRRLAALALTGLLVAGCTDDTPVQSRGERMDGGPRTNVVGDLQGPIPNPYGVAAGTFGMNPAEMPDPQLGTAPRNADWVRDAGLGYVRLTVYWASAQPNSSSPPDFSKYDYQVGLARDRGLKVMMSLESAPSWATGSNGPILSHWETYVQQIVQHYQTNYPGVVTHWSLWNEPNDPGGSYVPSAHYAAMVNGAAPAIRAIGGKVVALELAAMMDSTLVRPYMTTVLNSAGHNVDVVSVHGYSANVSGPSGLAQGLYDHVVETQLNSAWRWPIWLTEVGINACPNTDNVCGPTDQEIDDSFQATHLQQVMDAMADSQTPFWEKTFYYSLADEVVNSAVKDRGLIAGEVEAAARTSTSQPDPRYPRAAWYQYQSETQSRFAGHNVGYRAHSANNGWQPEVFNNRIAGIKKQTNSVGWAAHDIQAIQVRLTNVPTGTGVAYSAYVRGQGWQAEKTNGQMAGTVGQSLPMDGIRIRLTNAPSDLRICYTAVLSNGTQQAEVCDNTTAGIPGGTTSIVTLRIRLVTYSDPTPPPPTCDPTDIVCDAV